MGIPPYCNKCDHHHYRGYPCVVVAVSKTAPRAVQKPIQTNLPKEAIQLAKDLNLPPEETVAHWKERALKAEEELGIRKKKSGDRVKKHRESLKNI